MTASRRSGAPAPGDAPALHLEPGRADGRVLTHDELAAAVRRRTAELHAARPADAGEHPLLAVEGHRPAGVLIDVLGAIGAGWSVLVVNAGWWPRERDALFDRLRPGWVLAGGTDRPVGPIASGLGPAEASDGGARLWLASAGTFAEPAPYGFTDAQFARWQEPEPASWSRLGPGDLVTVTGDLGHAATMRAALSALAAGAELQLTDRTHLGGLLAARPHARVVTTPLLLRRSLRQLQRRGRRPAGIGEVILHQGPIRPHEPDEWAPYVAGDVQGWVSATESGGWLLHEGRAASGVEIRSSDDLDITVAGPASAVAGLGGTRPEPGWSGGDLAERTADGSWRWRGRRRDRFEVEGEQVDPLEVEAVLAAHPLVAEVAVAPRPHPERGNVVVAVLVPADPEWPPFLSDLTDLTEALPAAARPAALAIVDDLPVNAAGALHRRLVNYEEASR